MNVKKKILPVICLMSAYVHWIKPRLLTASASRGGKSLLLHLCARSRFLIPMIVFTAFWIFDAQMQIEATVRLPLSRSMRITLGPDIPRRVDQNVDDDESDDDTYTIVSYSDSYSTDISLYDLETALQDFAETDSNHELNTYEEHSDDSEQ